MPCRAASCGARVNDSHSPPQQKAGRRPHGWVLSMSGSSELGSSLRFCFPGLPHSCPLGLLSGLMTDSLYLRTWWPTLPRGESRGLLNSTKHCVLWSFGSQAPETCPRVSGMRYDASPQDCFLLYPWGLGKGSALGQGSACT